MLREAAASHDISQEHALLSGRVALLYAFSHHLLFLPFAALCMVATLFEPGAVLSAAAIPLILLIAASVGSNRLKIAYDNRQPGDDDAALWAWRYTVLSGITGAIWGVGAIIWFVPDSFPAQAYLVLGFLGMSATEFIARSMYRPAYLAHALFSLAPLVVLLALEEGLYQMFSAMIVLFFSGVLHGYGNTMADLLRESILLRRDNCQLIERLSQEKAVAEAARDVALSSDKTRSTFIASISHELRTPLNAMVGMTQLLERGDLEKAQRDHVKILLEAGRGLKTLLDDIIALAQQTDESQSTPEDGSDAAQSVRTVQRLVQPNVWEKRLRLSVNIAPSLPRAAADARLLRRVLLKLVGNAIKFTDHGHIEITVDTICGDDGIQKIRFAVADTGPGIPSHLQSAIFEPFAKADDAYAARHAGAGVGLAVAKKLVESAGGTIGVESEPGMGSKFWIALPASKSASSEEKGEEEYVVPPYGLPMLLFLPDNSMRSAVERLLLPFGNVLTMADSLADAVTMSSRGGFAVVIAAAASVDALASAPGQKPPILALATSEERQPDGADAVLRWPAAASALFAAIVSVTGEVAPAAPSTTEAGFDAAIDAKTISDLEKSLGFKTLVDILNSYLETAEELATSLSAARDNEDWSQAGRLAQDFAGAAGGLGLTAIATAARALAQGARDNSMGTTLSAATEGVLAEHERVRAALRRLYPELAA